MSEYRYAEGNLLDERNTYAYTTYGGPAFLEAWRRSRDAVLAELPPPVVTATTDGGPVDVDLDLVVRHFEVTKRIFGRYDEAGRPVDRDDYRDLARYAGFAEMVDLAYDASGTLTYLNALLKCLDTLVALRAELSDVDRRRLARLLERERSHVAELEAHLLQAGS